MPTIVRRLQGEGTVKIYFWILEVTPPPRTWIKIWLSEYPFERKRLT